MKNQRIKWHYIAEDGMPKIPVDTTKAYLVSYRVVGVKRVLEDLVVPTGEQVNVTAVALLWNGGEREEKQEGFTFTPSMQFYWGMDIYDTAYAWAEIPSPAPFHEIEANGLSTNIKNQ